MRVKIDENLPARLAEGLQRLGHDADTVLAEGLLGADDRSVWGSAQASRRVLITQDLDFSDRRAYRPGKHCGLVLVRLRSPDGDALVAKVLSLFRSEDVAGWRGCLVVVSDRKIRVIRPSANRRHGPGRFGDV